MGGPSLKPAITAPVQETVTRPSASWKPSRLYCWSLAKGCVISTNRIVSAGSLPKARKVSGGASEFRGQYTQSQSIVGPALSALVIPSLLPWTKLMTLGQVAEDYLSSGRLNIAIFSEGGDTLPSILGKSASCAIPTGPSRGTIKAVNWTVKAPFNKTT